MLKALELVGFKSFADKTRFEFPPGITVVVGPNGSGKSNIVDGIKWVLGEQSAKGLRGKDMADVIFKGSGGSGGRKPASMAEATLVVDNSDRRFEFDADEIRVTRRVYRDGEGEYALNGQPCRLKDIRDLFRGSGAGAGADAYSLIEQGKVDRLLQASPKDRRAIFEEAAGISRFKVKKIETQRRLARVDQNLLRLGDIVEEIESRLRTVRAQASKALRYQECTRRLQELRTYVGQIDWIKMTRREAELIIEEQQFKEASSAISLQVQQAEVDFRDAEEQANQIAESTAAGESIVAMMRARISEQESLRRLHRARAEELEQQLQPLRRQWLQRRHRLAELERQQGDHARVLEEAELAFRDASERVDGVRVELDLAQREGTEERDRIEHDREQLTSRERERSQLERRRDLLRQERDGWMSEAQKLRDRIDHWSLDRQSLDEESQSLERRARDLEIEMEGRSSELAAASAERERSARRREEATEKSAALRNRHHGLVQRASVIEELEEKLEGLTAGVKQTLRGAQQQDPAFAGVVGMVADLIQVQVEHAGLVDTALGEMAQAIVVDGDELVEAIAQGRLHLEGRVVALRLGRFRPIGTLRHDLEGIEGVIGRADQMVQTSTGFRDLATQLLGGTWIVRTLADALRLRQERAHDVRFLSLDGQIVDVDGTVALGPRGRGLGIVSRRSELRELKREIEQLGRDQDRVQEELIELRERIEIQTRDVERLRQGEQELSRTAAELRLQRQATSQRLDRVIGDLTEAEKQRINLLERIERADRELAQIEANFEQTCEALAALQSEIREAETRMRRAESRRTDAAKRLTEAEIERARLEQRLTHEEERAAGLLQEVEERRRTLDELEQQRHRLDAAYREAQLGQLAATTTLAEAALECQTQAELVRTLQVERQRLIQLRRTSSESLEKLRSTLRKLEGEYHKLELELGQLQSEKTKLAERLAEDYGIRLADLAENSAVITAPTMSLKLAVRPDAMLTGEGDAEETGESQQQPALDREAIETEIDSLRRRINTMGAVNLDALSELEELEARFGGLDAQYQDLVESKRMLEKIIEKINGDSRRMFAETLEIIRSNFQVLYRRSFGGGKADLVVEPGVDILDAGIDIVATPPGKPEFSNSLLSGGEKALTAVSLLMAIFQHRPSPFCVLDEVDAPFDEANVGRFIDVLKGFLDTTKFIIVTHSKKTMTAADTLYGVTMQESGISKRVSVRFEDVSDDGRIAETALLRDQEETGEQEGKVVA